MFNIYDDVSSKSWLTILILVIFFAVIVGIVILIKKYSPHFKSDEKPKSEEEIAKEEVERLTVAIDEDLPEDEPEQVTLSDVEQAGTPVKTKSHSEQRPSEEEATEYYMRNVLGIQDMPEDVEEELTISEEEDILEAEEKVLEQIDEDKLAAAKEVEKKIALDEFSKEFEKEVEEIASKAEENKEEGPTPFDPNKKKKTNK